MYDAIAIYCLCMHVYVCTLQSTVRDVTFHLDYSDSASTSLGDLPTANEPADSMAEVPMEDLSFDVSREGPEYTTIIAER